MMNICRRRLVRTWDRLLSRSIATEKKRRPLDERSGWEAVIGLEIHAQIASRSKLFSGAATDFDCSVNSAVSLFDCASPGTLPVLNRRCVEAAVAAALALNCRLRTVSSFDRKHYFYADMPAGYQITQQRSPIAVDGHLDFFAYSADEAPVAKRLRIERIQIEMDSGKTVHDLANRRSLVDLNRAGVGLIEIVTDHQLHTGLEAACFAEELRQVLVHIGVCGGEMQKGQLRVDANVSVRRVGEALGVRTEVKNLNSFKFIETAVKYEIDRQYRLLSEGGQVVNETRGYDDEGRTVSMRDKEVRQDYRFMPEPNLPPLRLSDGPSDDPNVVSISSIKQTLPAALADKRRWYIEKIGMDPLVAIYTVNDTARMKFVDDCFADKTCPPIESMAFWLDEYRLALRKHKMDFSTE
uniref:Aspartyl/Glutamyl-tRNA(Gln) amidotransferase subunit B/E catalytic domain-containing protein n=1 Tax=Plectus sambesii TaxID=2011161 RepID=A0A914US36_9BILA